MNFEGLQMQWETWYYLSSYRVHSQGYKMSLRCHHNLLNFCVFYWWQQTNKKKNSHSLGTMFKCIWKISFISFRKCYRLLDYELPWARCQPLNIPNFFFFADLAVFLIFLPSISHKRYLQSAFTISFPERTQ